MSARLGVDAVVRARRVESTTGRTNFRTRDGDPRLASVRRARSLARARLFDEDSSPGSPTAIETTSRATTRARMSIDDVEKMNSHTNLTLTARLDRLRADARLLHARGRG